MKRRVFIIIIVILSSFFSTSAIGIDNPAIDISNPGFIQYYTGLNAMRGWEFDTVENITVSQIGWFDYHSDGFTESHQIGIFDCSTMQLLVSGTVPSGNTSVLYEEFRYIDVPYTTLIAGNTYAIAGIAGSEYYAQNVHNIQCDPRIIYKRERYHIGNNFVFPDEVYSVGGTFGPNFMIVPEPATLILFAFAWPLGRGLALRKKKITH
jgi:hypothetical protein